jgi:hypothetical protein
MTRLDAIRIFNGDVNALAAALDVTLPRIYQWPRDEPLPQRDVDRVMGAALRVGMLRFKGGPVVRALDLVS